MLFAWKAKQQQKNRIENRKQKQKANRKRSRFSSFSPFCFAFSSSLLRAKYKACNHKAICVCMQYACAAQQSSYVWQNVSTFNCWLRKNDYTWLIFRALRYFGCRRLPLQQQHIVTTNDAMWRRGKTWLNSHKFSNQSPHIETLDYAHWRSHTTPTRWKIYAPIRYLHISFVDIVRNVRL